MYYSTSLVLNSRVLLMYTDTVEELPGYPVQNSPSGSFLFWEGSVGRGCTTWTGYFKCREVKTGFYRNRSMQTGSSGTLIGWKSGQTTFVPPWDRMEGAWLRTQGWTSIWYCEKGMPQKDTLDNLRTPVCFRILSSSFTSVSIFSFSCYSIVSISVLRTMEEQIPAKDRAGIEL